jgi:hypothetical protein
VNRQPAKPAKQAAYQTTPERLVQDAKKTVKTIT